jgi:hypothetical protein
MSSVQTVQNCESSAAQGIEYPKNYVLCGTEKVRDIDLDDTMLLAPTVGRWTPATPEHSAALPDRLPH